MAQQCKVKTWLNRPSWTAVATSKRLIPLQFHTSNKKLLLNESCLRPPLIGANRKPALTMYHHAGRPSSEASTETDRCFRTPQLAWQNSKDPSQPDLCLYGTEVESASTVDFPIPATQRQLLCKLACAIRVAVQEVASYAVSSTASAWSWPGSGHCFSEHTKDVQGLVT